MKIRIKELRRIIKEELQRLHEGPAPSSSAGAQRKSFAPTLFSGRENPLQRSHRDLMSRLLSDVEEQLKIITKAATNDRHDDAQDLSYSLIEIMDRLHFAASAEFPKNSKEALEKQMREFYDIDISGEVAPQAEIMVMKQVKSAFDNLKSDASNLKDQGSYGQALTSFGSYIVSALRTLKSSNARLSSRPPAPSR